MATWFATGTSGIVRCAATTSENASDDSLTFKAAGAIMLPPLGCIPAAEIQAWETFMQMRMASIVAAVLVLAAAAGAAPKAAASGAAEKPTLAVIDFVIKGDVDIKGAGEAAAELLLANLGGQQYQLIERSQLAALLKQLDLTLAFVQDNPEKVYGKLKGVQYLAMGSVTRLGDLTITARLVEVATGRIIQTAAVSAEDARGLKDAIGELATVLQMTPDEKAKHVKSAPRPAAAQYERALASIAERVAEVKARPGQTVAKGDLLVRLDNRVLQAELKRADAQAAEAQAAQAEANKQFDRTKSLYENSAASKADLDKAQAAKNDAEKMTASAQAFADIAKEAAGLATICAPAAGVVAEVLVSEGDLVRPQEEVVVIRKAAAAASPSRIYSENGAIVVDLGVGGESVVRPDAA